MQGPYTSAHGLPCDPAGTLGCPTYWRNNDGTRDFQLCDSAALYSDQALPFTCGSQLRRSLIKYFYRDYCPVFSGSGLRSALTSLIEQSVSGMRAGWTDMRNFACLDNVTGQCTFAACTSATYFEPCLSTSAFNVSLDAPTGNGNVLAEWLGYAVSYYPFVMQDPRPWTTYYNASAAPGQSALPAQWGYSPISALAAANELLFAPTQPVLSHAADEVYSMPSGPALTPTQLLEGSPWALCMAVLAQPWSTMPLGADDAPAGWEALRGVDWTDTSAVAATVRRLMTAALERSPLVWHRGRRHAPTPSAVCSDTTPPVSATLPPTRLYVGSVDVHLEQLQSAPVTTTLVGAPGLSPNPSIGALAESDCGRRRGFFRAPRLLVGGHWRAHVRLRGEPPDARGHVPYRRPIAVSVRDDLGRRHVRHASGRLQRRRDVPPDGCGYRKRLCVLA